MTNNRETIYRQAVKAGADLITALLNKGFIDEYGNWLESGKVFTADHFSARWSKFINKDTVNISNYDRAYRFCKQGDCLWLREGRNWTWRYISSFNPAYSLSLIEDTARQLEVELPGQLETFDDDDMLDI